MKHVNQLAMVGHTPRDESIAVRYVARFPQRASLISMSVVQINCWDEMKTTGQADNLIKPAHSEDTS